MTDKARKKLGYDEREQRMLEEFAMTVFLDPESTDDDRNKARARLMRGGRGKGIATVTREGIEMSTPNLNEWVWTCAIVLRPHIEPDDLRHKRRPPTLREKFVNAMALAQERWDALVVEDGQERALQLAHNEWRLLEGREHSCGKPADPIWTFCEPPLLTAQERLDAAMRRAQTAWEAYCDECRTNGQPEPRPFYAFKPQLIVPRDRAEIDAGDVGPHPAAD
jgi:hypothetical protein